mgnify:CR=1 FL=1
MTSTNSKRRRTNNDDDDKDRLVKNIGERAKTYLTEALGRHAVYETPVETLTRKDSNRYRDLLLSKMKFGSSLLGGAMGFWAMGLAAIAGMGVGVGAGVLLTGVHSCSCAAAD